MISILAFDNSLLSKIIQSIFLDSHKIIANNRCGYVVYFGKLSYRDIRDRAMKLKILGDILIIDAVEIKPSNIKSYQDKLIESRTRSYIKRRNENADWL